MKYIHLLIALFMILSVQTSDLIAATCNSPANLNAVVTNNSAVLSWDSVPGAKVYTIKAGIVGYAKTIQFNIQATSLPIPAFLKPCQEYFFSVAAKCDSGRSVFSSIDTFKTTGCITCDPPAAITSTVDTNSVVLSWDTVPNAKGYILELAAPGITPAGHWKRLWVKGNSKTLNFIPGGITIVWRVKTKCGKFHSVPSATDTFTTISKKIASSKKEEIETITSVYPNPASDKLNILTSENAHIQLIDLQGKVIVNQVTNGTSISLNTSEFETGYYILRVLTKEKSESIPVIIK